MTKAFTYIILFLFSSFILQFVGTSKLQAQPSCAITISKPMPVCPNSWFDLSVPGGEGYVFLWTMDGDSIGADSTIAIQLTDTAEFIVRVTDTILFEECESDPFEVSVHAPINVEFDQLQLTCTQTFLDLEKHPGAEDKTRTAVVKATASGDFQPEEYHYFWEVKPTQIAPGDSSTALGLKAHLIYNIRIIDNYGCIIDTGFRTEAYDNPIAEILADPDTGYIKKPFIKFTFTNLSIDSIDITNHFWEVEIGDPFYADSVIESDLFDPIITFPTLGPWPAFLTVYNPEGCDTLYSHQIEIKPVELFIPNVFTPAPTSEGSNDEFEIAILEDGDRKNTDLLLNDYYQSSKLVIFNRWGKTVFESDNYQNDWDGADLASGVYYYVLKCEGYNMSKPDVFKGAVTIVR